MDPVIIEVAVNGATRPTQQPHVPISPEQIAADGIACVDAGASIVHQHDDPRVYRDLGTGPEAMGSLGMAAYAGLLSARPDTIVYPTARFDGRTIAERWDHHRYLAEHLPAAGLSRLRMGLVDPGTVTLGNFTYGFTRDEVAYKLDACRDLGLGPSVACFEPGYIRVLLDFHAAGRVPPGSLVKFYFCAGPPLFGLPPSEAALDLYVDLLAGTGLPWAVAVLGGDAVGSGMARWAIERGGHVRVGLEDYAESVDLRSTRAESVDLRSTRAESVDLRSTRAESVDLRSTRASGSGRQPTNADLVGEVADLARACGRDVASPADTATLLHLP